MIEALQRVCELQLSYSAVNTPPMQERRNLIRTVLRNEIRALQPRLAPLLEEFGDDFEARASDGMGRKTEAPWVGFHSKRMSPNPRTGVYSVIHFSADGSAFWVTLGCAGTVWDGKDLQPLSEKELGDRTEWMRTVITERFGSIMPFVDPISLGARARLPRTFELATAVAQRFDPTTATENDVIQSLTAAAQRLREIYRAQKVGAHLSNAQIAEVEVEELVNPLHTAANGQGFRRSAKERRAIELRAMEVAKSHLESLGYFLTDCSSFAPFDYTATKRGYTIKVEVKGTTSRDTSSLFMTRNEVDLHRAEAGQTALVIVSGIELANSQEGPIATGGLCDCQIGWNIDTWEVVPIAFTLRRKA